RSGLCEWGWGRGRGGPSAPVRLSGSSVAGGLSRSGDGGAGSLATVGELKKEFEQHRGLEDAATYPPALPRGEGPRDTPPVRRSRRSVGVSVSRWPTRSRRTRAPAD